MFERRVFVEQISDTSMQLCSERIDSVSRRREDGRATERLLEVDEIDALDVAVAELDEWWRRATRLDQGSDEAVVGDRAAVDNANIGDSVCIGCCNDVEQMILAWLLHVSHQATSSEHIVQLVAN